MKSKVVHKASQLKGCIRQFKDFGNDQFCPCTAALALFRKHFGRQHRELAEDEETQIVAALSTFVDPVENQTVDVAEKQCRSQSRFVFKIYDGGT